MASHEHPYDLMRAYGEASLTTHMVPLMVDGLIFASSMVLLDSGLKPKRWVWCALTALDLNRQVRLLPSALPSSGKGLLEI